MKFRPGRFVDVVPAVADDEVFVFGDPQNLCSPELPAPIYSPITPAPMCCLQEVFVFDDAQNLCSSQLLVPGCSPISPASPRARPPKPTLGLTPRKRSRGTVIVRRINFNLPEELD